MEKNKIMRHINITRFDGKNKTQIRDHIIDEDILEIFVNDQIAFQMVFSMTNTAELAAGFLYTQGIVLNKTQILDIDIIENTKQCRITLEKGAVKRLAEFKAGPQIKGSSGGALLQNISGEKPANHSHALSITPEQVNSLIQQHWDHSKLFQKTGAVHSAALCSPTKILSYHEDIGRHNALDKLAGSILLNEIVTADKIATVSCRMSLEIVGKIISAEIPIVISNAAPTLKAVKLADKSGLTIIGFARNNQFNIYTHENRIRTMGN